MFSLANSPSESASRTGELNSSLNADAILTVVMVASGLGAGFPVVQRATSRLADRLAGSVTPFSQPDTGLVLVAPLAGERPAPPRPSVERRSTSTTAEALRCGVFMVRIPLCLRPYRAPMALSSGAR